MCGVGVLLFGGFRGFDEFMRIIRRITNRWWPTTTFDSRFKDNSHVPDVEWQASYQPQHALVSEDLRPSSGVREEVVCSEDLPNSRLLLNPLVLDIIAAHAFQVRK